MSGELAWDQLEVEDGEDDVHEEDQHEREHYTSVHRIADALRSALRGQPHVHRDHRGNETEDARLHEREVEIPRLREQAERVEIRAGSSSLQDHVEDVTA